VQHLFFDCRLARSVWNSLLIAFSLQPPNGTTHMFGAWIRSFAPSLRDMIILGWQQFVGFCGWTEMMQCSTGNVLIIACM